jgi:peptidoglycan/LPS O-acetylase OafA/YrhL
VRVVSDRGFRADIEGLRAVAVALVVLYHAGVTKLAGGYIGVDVFFVVSGFLITGLLVAELQDRSGIGLGGFYARRMRRLLPASVLVLVATVVLMKAFAPPLSAVEFRGDAIATALYGSNIRFALDATDYLSNPAPSPLQHYWSLAVEEQFYLVWPLLLLAVAKVRWGRLRTRLAIVVGGVLASSLALSVLVTPRRQPYAFFLLPTRAWELAAGAALALAAGSLARLPMLARRALTVGGLAGIAAAAVLFDDATMFPGTAAILPVAATAAVIAGGASRVLGARPLQWLGARSYTLYLWHWPLLVIPALGLATPMSATKRALLVVAAVVLAELTSRLVENPVRTARPLLASRARTFALGGALTAVAVGAAMVGGVLPTLDAGRPAAASASEEIDYVPSDLEPSLRIAAGDTAAIQQNGCNAGITGPVEPKGCVYGNPDGDRTIVLYGDSHAAHWFPALERAASEEGWRLLVLTRSGCTPVDIQVFIRQLGRRYTECEEWRESALELIAEQRDPVVLMATTRALRPMSGRPYVDEFEAGFARTVAELPASARVVLVADTPRSNVDVPTCLSTNVHDVDACAPPRSVALDPDFRAMEIRAARATGATLLDTTDWICPGDPCAPIRGNLLVWRDDHHLSSPFSASLAPRLRDALVALL